MILVLLHATEEEHWVPGEHSLILERIINEQNDPSVCFKVKLLPHNAGIYRLRIFSKNLTADNERQEPSSPGELKEILTVVFDIPEGCESTITVPRTLSHIWGPLDIPTNLRDGPYIDAAVVNQMRGHLVLYTRSFPFLFPLVLQRTKADIDFITKTFKCNEAEEGRAEVLVNSVDPYLEYEDESDRYFEYTLKFLESGHFVNQVFATKKWKDEASGRWRRAVQLIGQFLLDIRQDEKGATLIRTDDEELIGHLEIRSSY
ncbi:hypothetical protein SprV_0100403400 [Sparganum proliferum]